jgi:hypothetical protein
MRLMSLSIDKKQYLVGHVLPHHSVGKKTGRCQRFVLWLARDKKNRIMWLITADDYEKNISVFIHFKDKSSCFIMKL